MIKADQFIFPIAFTGNYPDGFAGYTFLQVTQQNALHPGIDWNWGAGEADYGKPVQCIANGQVVHQSRETAIGYGIIVVVKHELSDALYNFIKTKYGIDSRIIYSFYAHLKDEIVSDGQELNVGDLVGYVGKSGTTVSHLHQELYKAVPGTSWRYWPTLAKGWTQEKLKQYYIDTYDLVVNQPQSTQPTDTLESCQNQLKVEIENKNALWQEKKDLVTDLEGKNSQITSYENFQKSVAITLETEDDQAKILGGAIEYSEIKNQLREARTMIKNQQLSISQNLQLYDELKEKLQISVDQNKNHLQALQGVRDELTATIKINKTITKNLEDLKKDNKFIYKHLIFGLYIKEEK
ncbi:MAG: hypothetical protein UT24_C0029G0021 [Candidatus Woesebacteria bacterium GW2011_GWB1_39_12]|uniref:M23ase beta-sheet core domain-containing protein n=1 Tax=Candidatus Woesebacteria bacterium GW2011_GWB1_39_12 TaxID=1618574 RepID=A0A0G0PLJ3_9BACT|nr:MAG: hypothetical protein UT24_C0029G0021 [Candidatus Woesebacteria bacterium GW2011_GWB1_39_12]